MLCRVPFSLSAAAKTLAVLIVVWGRCSVGECSRECSVDACSTSTGPICEPGLLSRTNPNSVEVYDPNTVGSGLSITPICSQLLEPRVQATVEPSLQTILRTWTNISAERNYFWGYWCEGENMTITAARNCSAVSPDDTLSGAWTTIPRGSCDRQPLSLGDVCHFFGCYTYTVFQLGKTSFHATYYIENFNSTSCVIDRDECSDAQCEHDCVNFMTGTNNSYQCMCRRGFSLSQDQHNCTDIDECSISTDNCDQICTTDDTGWYNCSCVEGYTLNQNGHSCDDIDECQLNGTALCDTEVTGRNCTNTVGSYDCQCLDGFHFNQDQKMCEDIDECSLGTSLCQQQCVNTDGGYNCTCSRWYVPGSPGNCSEVDVCTELAVDCGSNSHCQSFPETEEGFACVCDSGYEQNNNSCTLKGIVHVYWIVSIVILFLFILLLGCVCLLRRKYIQNRHDKEKQYSVLFKYQLKKEEVDPSYIPVGFNPVRKVSYTFSLVSSLETYEYPTNPVILEPDNTGELEGCFTWDVESPHNGYLMAPVDYDHSKRELSAITEANEDGISDFQDEEVHDTNLHDSELRLSQSADSRDENNCHSILVSGSHGHEGETGGETTESSSGYIKEANTGVVACLHRPPSRHSSSSCTAEGNTERGDSPEGNGPEQTQTDSFVHMSDFSRTLHVNNNSLDGPPADGGISVSTIPLTYSHLPSLLHSEAQPNSTVNDGYIPTGSISTCSGYVTETDNSSSTHFSSASSCITNSGISAGSSYIPSHPSTTSSGYASEPCISVDKRGSHDSQLSHHTPRMPMFCSEWANGDYVTESSLSGSPLALTRKTSALVDSCNGVSFCSAISFGTPNDCVFNDDVCTPYTRDPGIITPTGISPHDDCHLHKHSPKTSETGYVNAESCDCHRGDTSSLTQFSTNLQATCDGDTVSYSPGYIPYPGQNEDKTIRKQMLDNHVFQATDNALTCSISDC